MIQFSDELRDWLTAVLSLCLRTEGEVDAALKRTKKDGDNVLYRCAQQIVPLNLSPGF